MLVIYLYTIKLLVIQFSEVMRKFSLFFHCCFVLISRANPASSHSLKIKPSRFIFFTILYLKILQVFCMYITGHLNSVFPEEYRREILRYMYYHQVHLFNLLDAMRTQLIMLHNKQSTLTMHVVLVY